MAKALIRAVAENAPGSICKFQDWRAANVSADDPDKARYEALQFKDEWYDIIPKYCEENGVEFLTSCFNKDRVNFLASKGLEKIKIASVCLTNHDLLIHAGLAFKEIILSTAMATREQIEEAADALASSAQRFTLMQCVANYPCPFGASNLLKMNSLKELVSGQEYASVGYSSHALDLDVPKVAVAMGAKYVEVHFSLSRHLPQTKHQMYAGGPLVTTHEVSLEPHELRQLADWRDKVALMKGDGAFSVNEVESKIKDRYLNRYGK